MIPQVASLYGAGDWKGAQSGWIRGI